MKKIIRVLTAVAAGLALAAPGTLATPAAAAGPAPAGQATRLELPRPTGTLAVVEAVPVSRCPSTPSGSSP
ncbi:hypothetical protein ACWD0G_20785, partial [Streptomyces goshikiensis]